MRSFSKYLVGDLRAACVRRGLSTKGTRRTLIARLKDSPEAPVYAINHAVPAFPSSTNELVSAIYYDIPKFNVRILLLGEYHEQPCNNVISNYVEALRDSLNTRGECLDYYLESTFGAIEPAGHTYIPSIAGGGCLGNAIRTYIPKQGRRVHFSDARDKIRRITLPHKPITSYIFNFPLYSTQFMSSNLRQLMLSTLTELENQSNPPIEKVDALKFAQKTYLSYNPQELLAFYYGIGPHATRSGNTKLHLRNRYRKDVENMNIALETVIEYLDTHTGIHIDDAWVEHKMAFIMTLEDLAVVRSRSRKTLKEFIQRHRHTCPPKKLFKAMQATIIWASRFVGHGPSLSKFSIEAMADIYAFLRMFRFFDVTKVQRVPVGHPALNNCVGIGNQRTVIYHSHVAHSIHVALLIRLVFGIEPTNYFEADTPVGGNGYASAYMNGFTNVVNGFDTRNYDNFDNSITTNMAGRPMSPYPQSYTNLRVPPGTKFFQ